MDYKGIIFDDYVKDEHGVWSQICPACLKKYGEKLASVGVDNFGDGICGVKGCNSDEQTVYIDF